MKNHDKHEFEDWLNAYYLEEPMDLNKRKGLISFWQSFFDKYFVDYYKKQNELNDSDLANIYNNVKNELKQADLERLANIYNNVKNEADSEMTLIGPYDSDSEWWQENEEENEQRSKNTRYKDKVFEYLEKKKRKNLTDQDRLEIQNIVENMTMSYDEESTYKFYPNIVKIFINKEHISAKDYLKSLKSISKEDKEMLSVFGQYSIECTIIYVLSTLFNTPEASIIVRVASLIEQLESAIRVRVDLLGKRSRKDGNTMSKIEESSSLDNVKEVRKSKISNMYPIGTALVQMMVDRGLISFYHDKGATKRVEKKSDGIYYIPHNVYAYCEFDPSYLPIKFNLPMIYPPEPWRNASRYNKPPKSVSDLTGGYLSCPTGEFYDRYRLLSSGDYNHFYIDLVNGNYQDLCDVMNKLQSQPFKVNSRWLQYIHNNEPALIDNGFLLPGFISKIHIKDVSKLLMETHMNNQNINTLITYCELLATLSKMIQRSRYERFILRIANVYNGYRFYLPAFLDFRGRIYRCGLLHFHERDLARSLILFDDEPNTPSNMNDRIEYERIYEDIYTLSLIYHYKSFSSYVEARDWFIKNYIIMSNNRIQFARDAKHPFQFLSSLNVLILKMDAHDQNTQKIMDCDLRLTPITQDAAASAYQLLSYFLLDERIAERTNLISSSDDKINDIYTAFMEELKEYLNGVLSPTQLQIVNKLLTRKIVKGIFMPLVYGKTVISTANDLKAPFSQFFNHRDCLMLAKACYDFWKTKYNNMECLIRLIRNIGWVSSFRNCPVFYSVPYFTTVQDYMKMDSIKVTVYDKENGKRRRVSMKVTTSARDRRKAEIATFVNFLHQKDAQIAMNVIIQMLENNLPIYTVHDNFITTAEYSYKIARIYGKTIIDMGPPLSIINEFIYINIIKPSLIEEDGTEDAFARKMRKDWIIPSKVLRDSLNRIRPAKLKSSMRKTWEGRVDAIVKSYEEYSKAVSYDDKDYDNHTRWILHTKRWEMFADQITAGINKHYSFCVHY